MSAPRWLFDRTGFPYLAVPEAGVAVALLPVTKAQAEFWLGDPSGPGDDWYAEVLAVAPRVGWRASGKFPLWHLLLTGVHPGEAERLAAWLGPEYRLPSAAEWRAADRALSALSIDHVTALMASIEGGKGHPAAAGILRRPWQAKRRTAAQLALLEDGVLEWVARPAPPHGALGRPAADLPAKLILDPQAFDPVTLITPGRHAAFGARLVRALGPGARDG
jgi:hypothetical protein